MPRSSQFERPSGCVEMISSSGAKVRSASSIASSGSPSPIWPRASMPGLAHRRERRRRGGSARRSRARSSSETQCLSGVFSAGQTTNTWARTPSTRALDLREQLLAADRLVRDHEDPVLAVRCVGGACGTAAPRAGRGESHQTRIAVSPMKTPRPSHVLITRRDDDQREVDDRQPDEPESLRLGAERVPHYGNLPSLQDVDRDVHHDPHYVDEVPVDPADLDAVMVLGAEMAPEGAYRHPSRIVRPTKTWSPCRPVRPKNVDGNAPSLVLKPIAVVLDHLRQQERQAEQEGQRQPALEPGAVAALDRLRRPVHGEARRDEDARVDERDVPRPDVALGRPLRRPD